MPLQKMIFFNKWLIKSPAICFELYPAILIFSNGQNVSAVTLCYYTLTYKKAKNPNITGIYPKFPKKILIFQGFFPQNKKNPDVSGIFS